MGRCGGLRDGATIASGPNLALLNNKSSQFLETGSTVTEPGDSRCHLLMST